MLAKVIEIIKEVCSNIKESPIYLPAYVASNKMESVVNKNYGYQVLQTICKHINGAVDRLQDNLECNLSPIEIAWFKCALITSCEVKRSFSTYNSIFFF